MKLSDFEPVTMAEKDLFREYYDRHPPEHSDYMHSIMVAWSDYMNYGYTILGDSLVILTEFEGKRRLRPPIGEFDTEITKKVMDLARDEGFEHVLSMIGNSEISRMKESFPELVYIPHREYYDYVYLADDLADLPGKPYLKVRNYLNKFRRENPHHLESIDDGNIKDASEFLDRWCKQKNCKGDPFLVSERDATRHALDNLTDLDLSGTLIRIDDRVEALAIFEKMSDEMAVIHYEKANMEINGLYQAINNETAMVLRDRYKYINRESDMGVPGLRKAKMKYRPHHMLEIHHAVL